MHAKMPTASLRQAEEATEQSPPTRRRTGAVSRCALTKIVRQPLTCRVTQKTQNGEGRGRKKESTGSSSTWAKVSASPDLARWERGKESSIDRAGRPGSEPSVEPHRPRQGATGVAAERRQHYLPHCTVPSLVLRASCALQSN